MSDCTSEKHCDHSDEMGETGSRKWFWWMRLRHSSFWLTPGLMLVVASSRFHRPGSMSQSLTARLVHSVPWVVAAVGVAAVAHALWRIEVNMAAWEQPFTKKDAQVLRKASAILLMVDSVILFGGLFVLPVCLLLAGGPDLKSLNYVNAMLGPLMVTTALLMVNESIKRFYGKAKHAYAELEKGV
jgi:hypothetical protein